MDPTQSKESALGVRSSGASHNKQSHTPSDVQNRNLVVKNRLYAIASNRRGPARARRRARRRRARRRRARRR
jgi:hypothetical protein